MKVFTYRLKDDQEQLWTGRLSPSYARFGNFMRYWARTQLAPGRYRAYIYEGPVGPHQQPSLVRDITIVATAEDKQS